MRDRNRPTSPTPPPPPPRWAQEAARLSVLLLTALALWTAGSAWYAYLDAILADRSHLTTPKVVRPDRGPLTWP